MDDGALGRLGGNRIGMEVQSPPGRLLPVPVRREGGAEGPRLSQDQPCDTVRTTLRTRLARLCGRTSWSQFDGAALDAGRNGAATASAESAFAVSSFVPLSRPGSMFFELTVKCRLRREEAHLGFQGRKSVPRSPSTRHARLAHTCDRRELPLRSHVEGALP